MNWIDFSYALVIIHITLAKLRRFHHMVDQRLETHGHVILNGTLQSLEACALLCTKNENCTSFSYQKTTKQFSMSSAFPVYTSNSMSTGNHLPEVFMKAQEIFCSESGNNFTHIDLTLTDSNPHHTMAGKFSIKACATNCVEYNGCIGFTYFSITTKCVLISSNLTTTEQGADGPKIDGLTYLLSRKEDSVPSYTNIAQGKPTLQSSTHHPYESDNGVNGDYTDTTATTIDNEKPYWRVDLQAVCIVVGVRVFNNERWGLATYPIYNPVVYVGMTDTIAYTDDEGDVRAPHLDHPVCDHLSGNIELLVMDFDCTTPIPGHYVIIDSYKQGEAHYLYFAELEVHGYC